jgi:hypothetical protein
VKLVVLRYRTIGLAMRGSRPFTCLPLLSRDAQSMSIETMFRLLGKREMKTVMTGDGAYVFGNDGGVSHQY